MTRHFEDFTVGDVIDCGSTVVDEDEMLDFARRYDPQPFHTDPVAAKDSPFGGVIASGFFSLALWMRLYVDTVLADSTSQGSGGMSELRWFSPVRAGDQLAGRLTVLDMAPSQTKPGRGTVYLRGELLRDGEVVLRCEFRALFGRREL